MRYHFVPMRFVIITKTKTRYIAVGSVKWLRCHGNSLVISQKAKYRIAVRLDNLTNTHLYGNVHSNTVHYS